MAASLGLETLEGGASGRRLHGVALLSSVANGLHLEPVLRATHQRVADDACELADARTCERPEPGC
eukprot:2347653-Heterocapsa_arctica.AAC.1